MVESGILQFSTPTRPPMPGLLWVGLIDLHLIISTFLLLAPIGYLSIHPSVCLPDCLPVCLMCQYNVSMLSLQVQMCCSCTPLRLLFYFVLKAAWDGSSTVITNCDFTVGPKVVVAAPSLLFLTSPACHHFLLLSSFKDSRSLNLNFDSFLNFRGFLIYWT